MASLKPAIVAGMDKHKLHTMLSLTLLALGLALIAYMVTVEGELGALPLALVLAGAIWFAITRFRRRKS